AVGPPEKVVLADLASASSLLKQIFQVLSCPSSGNADALHKNFIGIIGPSRFGVGGSLTFVEDSYDVRFTGLFPENPGLDGFVVIVEPEPSLAGAERV